MIRLSCLLLFLWTLLVTTCLTAKDYNYIRFTTSDGLAGNNVYCIAQDHDGFLWIATETGLSRFDGHNFKNFTTGNGLPRNEVFALFLDKKNRVWIFPFCDDPCYYQNGKLYNRSNSAMLRAIPWAPGTTKGIGEDKNGNLLLHAGESYAYIRPGNKITLLSKPYKGKPFFYPQKSISQLPLEVIVPELQKLAPDTLTYENNMRVGDAWIVNSWRRVYLYENGVHKELLKTDMNDFINAVSPSDTNVLINTANGCYLYDFRTRKVYDTLLKGMSVNVSFRDQEGGVWVGTNGSGIYYFSPIACVGKKALIDGVPDQIHYFHSYKGSVWAGSNNYQYWSIDVKNKRIGNSVKLSQVTSRMLYQPPGVLQKDAYKGVMKVLGDKHKRSFPLIVSSAKSIMNVGDTFIAADLNGVITKFTFPNRVWSKFYIGKRATCGLYQDGIYYAGTLDTLFAIAGEGISRKAILRGSINTLAYSRQNKLLWVGTQDDGVYCLRDDKVIRHFSKKNGLSNNICKCIFTDGTKAFIGTVDGLNIIDPEKNFQIDQYYTLDGLLSNEINCIYVSGNTLAAGTSEGISFLDISLGPPSSPCKLALAEVVVSKRNLATDNYPVSLRPGDNNIQFAYSGISFRSMGRMKYIYRLKGLDDKWQETNQDYLAYPSLPPDDYVFEIYAVNRFDVRSNVLRFPFTIQKRWWQHWWVQALFMLGLAGLLMMVIGVRARRKRKREKEKLKLKEKIVELEQLALRSQMNPHFIFNSLNSFYQYVIRKDLRGASEYMGNFSRLIRLLFETTTLTETSLEKEIDFLSTYLKLEKTKHNNKFTFDFNIQPGLIPEEIIVPTFIIQPFIENSIRHGILNRNDSLGHIGIHIYTGDNGLIVQVDDNGVGRSGAEKRKGKVLIHRSRGLSLTQERLDLYNRIHGTKIAFNIFDQHDEQQMPTGTKVTISFPLK